WPPHCILIALSSIFTGWPGEQHRGDVKAGCLGRLEVDDELEISELLNWSSPLSPWRLPVMPVRHVYCALPLLRLGHFHKTFGRRSFRTNGTDTSVWACRADQPTRQ